MASEVVDGNPGLSHASSASGAPRICADGQCIRPKLSRQERTKVDLSLTYRTSIGDILTPAGPPRRLLTIPPLRQRGGVRSGSPDGGRPVGCPLRMADERWTRRSLRIALWLACTEAKVVHLDAETTAQS